MRIEKLASRKRMEFGPWFESRRDESEGKLPVVLTMWRNQFHILNNGKGIIYTGVKGEMQEPNLQS